MSTSQKTDVFQFMSVRSPKSIEKTKLRHFYIQDEYISSKSVNNQPIVPHRKLREIFSMNSESELGKIIYKKIFCEVNNNTIPEKNDEIVQLILELVEFKTVMCEDSTDIPPQPLVNELEQTPYIYSDYKYYLLPAILESIICEFEIDKLLAAKKIIEKHVKGFTRATLLDELNTVFGTTVLTEILYAEGEYASNYRWARNILFEKLYILHILRRLTSINLEQIITGLQTLHTLEFLAADDFIYAIKKGKLDINDASVIATSKFLSGIYEEFKNVDLLHPVNNLYFIDDKNDLLTYFQSAPIIHPIIAKLHWYKTPFNAIKPIGLGDLKVVKQWLCGYKVGEISHIHNIMKGEEKERNLRHLEKTEEVFSFSSEQSKDTQQESQTTDRFEMKKETEKVIKTDININAHADFTYKGTAITANVGGGFAYTNSNQDTQRSASNFARDVMDKAVTQIQSKSSQQRSITKIFETEEKNNHKFTNTLQGATHISGIYRWLDKKYKAQLYNYGKRMMFEFLIPEPSAFYITSKLKAAEFDISAPQKPIKKVEPEKIIFDPNTLQVPLAPKYITEDIFNNFRLKYDLEEFSFPKKSKIVLLVDKLSGKSIFSKYYDPPKDAQFSSDHFDIELEEKGYLIEGMVLSGEARFWDQSSESNHWSEKNRFGFYINGRQIDYRLIDKGGPLVEAIQDLGKGYDLRPNKIDVGDGKISLDLEFRDVHYYNLNILLSLELDPNFLLTWQLKVYNKIKSIEKINVDKINQENEAVYNAALSDYQNKLNQLNAQTVNDIIQGRSEAFNRLLIRDELKKHCITMIAKEFDSFDTDDILSNEDAIEPKNVTIQYDKFFAGEVTKIIETAMNATNETETVAGFISATQEVEYPKINIEKAKKKERFIQFLEQAFEWEQIAYIFYPYFWAAENKWITLMNRLDYTDNNMTAFLKAGSARVLIAVTPHYNDAVMHFIATREPWEGGPLPVIGDPLFIPIYEEIKKQQDDLLNATPEGTSWTFELPTSLVYLNGSSNSIPPDSEFTT